MVLLDGKILSAKIKEEVKVEVTKIVKEKNITPGLAVILVGNDAASATYVASKAKACKDAGIYSVVHEMPESITQEELLETINMMNNNPKLDGILVQLPLPKHIDTTTVLEAINPLKDVDGFHPYNVGRMVSNLDSFLPATPFGVMRMFEEHNIELSGKDVVVIGSSDIVGKPMASLLINKKATIQGFGNVGYYTSKVMEENGALVVGVAEFEGGLYNAKGIDIEDLKKYQLENKTIRDYPKAKFIKHSNLLMEHECDILVPAALENQITKENAPRIKAKIIGEGANGPVTPEAEQILLKKGILIVPDLYLNAGGVTVSYFEWLKNLSHVSFGRLDQRFQDSSFNQLMNMIEKNTGKKISKEERNIIHGASELDLVRSGLEDTMMYSYENIHEIWKKHKKISLRTAAYVNAINKVGASYMELGVFP